MMTASRRATATIARFIPRCRATRPLAAVGHQDRGRLEQHLAHHGVSAFRDAPHPVDLADCCQRGVRPKAAPTAFELVKREGTSTVARKVSATTGPTPGVVISLRQTSS
jgi:hypothetical protein